MQTSHDLPDEEIEAAIGSNENVRGPLTFRGRPLGKYSLNAAGLVSKVLGLQGACQVADALDELRVYPGMRNLIEPKLIEHDFLLLEILASAYVEKDELKFGAYRNLLQLTDDTAGFRARVAMQIEAANEADRQEARRLVNQLLEETAAARVEVEKKTDSEACPAPAPKTTTSPSGSSPKKRAGRKTTSAGS